jgi:hypothetical protein
MGVAYGRLGGERQNTGFWWGDLKDREHFEDLDVDDTTILEWMLKK